MAKQGDTLTMEYLVTMTTHVPEGTPEADVQEIRAREAARSGELAAQGHLLRLCVPRSRANGARSGCSPPQRPGTRGGPGLDAAARVAHRRSHPAVAAPERPGAAAAKGGTEFLTTFTLSIPEGTPAQVSEDVEAREARRAKELAGQGRLLRLWLLPGPGQALGLWRARDAGKMHAIVRSLPLDPWLTTEITPLTPHPGDPVLTGSPDADLGSQAPADMS